MTLPSSDIRVTRVGAYVFLSWDSEQKPVLTDAEREVVALVLKGRRNREIARERGVSERTIANQLASAYRKLGVGSRFELVARIRRASTRSI